DRLPPVAAGAAAAPRAGPGLPCVRAHCLRHPAGPITDLDRRRGPEETLAGALGVRRPRSRRGVRISPVPPLYLRPPPDPVQRAVRAGRDPGKGQFLGLLDGGG